MLATYHWPRIQAPTVSPGLIAQQVARHPGVRDRLRRRTDPNGVMGTLLSLLFVGVAIMATLFGLVSVMVRTNTGIARLDQRAAQWGADHATSGATSALRSVSLLVGTEWAIPLMAVIIIVELRRTHRRSTAAFLLLTVIGQNLIVNITKLVVSRARPNVDQLTGISGYSFPSGHSAQSAAMYAAIALVLGRRRGRLVQAVLAGAAVAVAVAVATSRVLLGVHWLTDVVGGLAVGWGWFALVSAAFGGRWLHFGAPVEAARVNASVEPPQNSGDGFGRDRVLG
jgi:undecaprenyl-diphosphatase